MRSKAAQMPVMTECLIATLDRFIKAKAQWITRSSSAHPGAGQKEASIDLRRMVLRPGSL